MPSRPLLIFRVAEHLCALPLERVRETLLLPALMRTPGQPPLLEGFMNLRGCAVAVVRARRLFDLPPAEPGLYTPLIVIDARNPDLALLVDSVDDIAAIAPGDLLSISPEHSLNDIAEGQFSHAGAAVTVLSCDRLLLAGERRRLAELQAEAQRRIGELGGQAA